MHFYSGRYDEDEGIEVTWTPDGLRIRWRADVEEITLPPGEAADLRNFLNDN